MDKLMVVVGYSSVAREGFKVDESTVQAPSNYKDPEKIAEYKKKAVDKMVAEAGTSILTSRFERVIVGDGYGNTLEADLSPNGVPVINQIVSFARKEDRELMNPEHPMKLDIYAFDISLLRHLLIMNAIAKRSKAKDNLTCYLLFPHLLQPRKSVLQHDLCDIGFYDPSVLITGASFAESRKGLLKELFPGDLGLLTVEIHKALSDLTLLKCMIDDIHG